MTIVRDAARGDIPRIIELYRQLVITTSPAEMSASDTLDEYQRVFNQICSFPDYKLLVAEEQGEVIGTLVLLIVPNLSHNGLPWAMIENMVVDSGYQRQGIGKQLMDYAKSQAKEAGCYKIQLLSDKRRKNAHQFYQALGFEPSAQGFRLYF